VNFNVVYSKGLPFSYDYFKLGDKTIKAYSEDDFRLTATISNKTNKTILVQEIKVQTIRFEDTKGLRVLRQFKQKGLFKPLKLTFIPKQYLGGEVELNKGNLIEIEGYKDEHVVFKLSKKCLPGYYEILFEISCLEGNNSFSLYSPVFQVHKRGNKNDYVSL